MGDDKEDGRILYMSSQGCCYEDSEMLINMGLVEGARKEGRVERRDGVV